MLPTENLMQDHRVIERICRVLNAAASHLEAEGNVEPRVFEDSIRFVREFADSYHHGKEEELLFPALEAHGLPREGGPTGIMRLDHNQGRDSVRGMAEALQRWVAGDDSARSGLARHARNYSQLLLEHIPKEDNILYPIADGMLERDEQQALASKFQSVEAEKLGQGKYQDYVNLAGALEAKVSAQTPAGR